MEETTTIKRKFRVSPEQMSEAGRECDGAGEPVPDEKMEEFLDDSSDKGIAEFNRAKEAGFPWQFFFGRIQRKAALQGVLPSHGLLVILPNHISNADSVLWSLLNCASAVGEPLGVSAMREPWKDPDPEMWRQALCGYSVSMFDAGAVAALTKGRNADDDPVFHTEGLAVFGDVGVMGLRRKAVAFIEKAAGAAWVDMMAVVGNEACVHLRWDRFYTDMAFKLSTDDRNKYFFEACKAAYLAGACFAETACKLNCH